MLDNLVDKFTEHSQKMQVNMMEVFNSYQQNFQETFLAFEEKRLKMQLAWEEKQKREEREHQLRMLQTLAQMFQSKRTGDGRTYHTNSIPESSNQYDNG